MRPPSVVEDRAPARSADRGAHPVAVRHPPDLGPARRRARAAATARHRHRARQPVHPHDRDVRHGWQAVQDVGAQVSIAFPIEMNMRHGMPPILKMQSLGMEPSLCVDVECTMTADFFTQMRVAMNMQRMLVNQMILDQRQFPTKPNRLGTSTDAAAISGRRRPPARRRCSRPATCCATPP